ncbi:MAG: hypothetical protein F4X94_00540 [Dehalococcoidia bacterium]|nr:hypothetical protein [Dehalococcoidia bacterium]
MTNEWLSAQNFERSYRLVSAINTISIHEKLKEAGVNDESRLDEVAEAKDVLLEFLKRLDVVVRDTEQDPERLVEGVDPRMGDLARGFLNAQRQRPQTSAFAAVSLDDLSRRMEMDDGTDTERLLNCLRDLRNLLEDHANSDVAKILGEV